jgi:uncharacterized SAM-binding protein YcdF (DUF218 family)
VLACVVLLAAPIIRWQSTLSFLGHSLVYSQAPQSADLILVLAGNFYGGRVLKAAELATQGYAPRVLISGTPYQQGLPEGDFAIAFLARQGYATRLFESFGQHAHSTIEEANVLCGELARRRVQRVILVTSTYHSRRAAIVFQLFCPGVHFISVPGSDVIFHEDGWWRDKSSRSLVVSEWTKILGTVLMAYPKERLARMLGLPTGKPALQVPEPDQIHSK